MNTGKKMERRTRLLAIVAVATSLTLVFTYVKLRRVTVPPELVGTWRTTDVRYAEHPFELGLVSINFGTGEGSVSTGFIDNIQSTIEHGRTFYTISYSVDGTQDQVSFYYDGSGDRTIQFKNQEQVTWKKDNGSLRLRIASSRKRLWRKYPQGVGKHPESRIRAPAPSAPSRRVGRCPLDDAEVFPYVAEV